jgi:hypothetical protein
VFSNFPGIAKREKSYMFHGIPKCVVTELVFILIKIRYDMKFSPSCLREMF